jgi:hypothetical protein
LITLLDAAVMTTDDNDARNDAVGATPGTFSSPLLSLPLSDDDDDAAAAAGTDGITAAKTSQACVALLIHLSMVPSGMAP